jgi:hypothetical protein
MPAATIENDISAEALWWLQVIELKENVYDKPFTVPESAKDW